MKLIDPPQNPLMPRAENDRLRAIELAHHLLWALQGDTVFKHGDDSNELNLGDYEISEELHYILGRYFPSSQKYPEDDDD